jgi:HSP20 family protein
MEDIAMLPIIRKNSYLPNIFDDLFKDDFWPAVSKNNLTPAVNITENEKEFNIEVAAPGLEKDDFKLNLEDNVLSISCEKEMTKEDKNEKYIRKEFNYASFYRSFILPENVIAEDIKATHKNGVLNISVPKPEEVKKVAKNIQIS